MSEPESALAPLCNEARITEVLPDFLFISDMTAALDEELVLRRKKFTHIVNCSNREAPNKFEECAGGATHHVEQRAKTSGYAAVKYLNVDVDDDGSVPEDEMVAHFERVHAFIAAEASPRCSSSSRPVRVLVHCLVGRSRSASVVTALLMQLDPMRFVQRPLSALRFLQERRPVARPNAHFLRALIALSERLMDDGRGDVDGGLRGGEPRIGSQAGPDSSSEHGGTRRPEWEREKSEMRRLAEETEGEENKHAGQLRNALDGIAGEKRGGTGIECVLL